VAVEPQPGSGALAGAAAGPAGRAAIETPYAAKAALSDAPGIGAGPRGAKRPRRMGLCSEVADGGENLEDHPRPPEQIRLPQGPVSACKIRKFVSGALNLLHSVQTKSCLGHCITRGLGLRRQATILRLRGAALFSRGKAGPARGNSNARAGLERLDSAEERARQLTS
jgi:hypothetical protein